MPAGKAGLCRKMPFYAGKCLKPHGYLYQGCDEYHRPQGKSSKAFAAANQKKIQEEESGVSQCGRILPVYGFK